MLPTTPTGPTVSPAPGDWAPNNVITGFWRLDDGAGWAPDADFEAFLSTGDTPVYLGFGSMPWGAQRNTEIITKAITQWGGRAVIGKGWGGVKAEDLPKSVDVVDRAPHTELFKHVKAVVHHGGAGTTQTGLEAGRPTFAVPQFFDQPYWGKLIYELGWRTAAGAAQEADAADPRDGAGRSVQHARLCARCRSGGEKMRLEDGTNRAVDVIEETIADYGSAGPRDNDTYELGAAP